MSPTQAAEPEVSAPAAQATTQRVSMLCGDRACAKCTFNLVGQHVVREPHYGMLVVICPECGTPAALQEHPLLGRWVGRWGAALAGLWMLFMLVVLAGSAGAVFGFCYAGAEESGQEFATFIAKREVEWAKLQQSPSPSTPVTPAQAQQQQQMIYILQQNAGPYTQIDPSWWATQDPDALLREAGGWLKALDRAIVYIQIGATLPMIALGCVWAVLMSHVRRTRLWLVLPLILAVVSVYATIAWSVDNAPRRWGGYVSARDHARAYFFVPVLAAMGLTNALLMFGGLMLGRPLARLLVRVLLPPRLRVPMAFLWICDGKPAPRPFG